MPAKVPAAFPAGNQLLEIILLKPELTHDIHSDIIRLERMRKLQDTPILSSDDSDNYIITRHIDRAVNQALSRMQAYLATPSPFVRRISTNHAHEWEEKNIFLSLPHNWPTHLIDNLRDAVHTYIVKSVEYNILLVALSEDSYTALCQLEADKAYNEINSIINTRLGTLRIHPTPFG